MADQHAMDEQVLDEIRFHQDVVTRDANSPLFQIREKEMEIAGRVLAARTEAEKIVTGARQKATDIIKGAESESERLAKERSEQVLSEADTTVESVKHQNEVETVELEQALHERLDEAADYVVRLVTTV